MVRIKPAHTVAACRTDDPQLYQVLKVFWRHSQYGAGLLEFECDALHMINHLKFRWFISRMQGYFSLKSCYSLFRGCHIAGERVWCLLCWIMRPSFTG